MTKSNEKKSKTSGAKIGSKMRFASILTIAFVAIACMALVVTSAVLSVVWEKHFESYTRSNLVGTAEVISTNIEKRILAAGDEAINDPSYLHNENVYWPAVSAYGSSNHLGVAIIDIRGNVVWDSRVEQAIEDARNGEILMNDTAANSKTPLLTEDSSQQEDTLTPDMAGDLKDVDGDKNADPSQSNSDDAVLQSKNDEDQNQQGDRSGEAAGTEASDSAEQGADEQQEPYEGVSHSVKKAIVVNGVRCGTVSVWVSGASNLLTEKDLQFRTSSYQAMAFAACIAILLALSVGPIFSRRLVRPINKMSSTANAIARGDLSARTELHGQDEISQLGETFDAMAESIEKDKELERRLTTDVAHELRTPLMAIQSTVEAIADGVFEATPDRLETVSSEVQRLSRLVDALLKLSRLESKTPLSDIQKLNVGKLVEAIILTHEAYVLDANLKLKKEIEPEVYVDGNADLIRQATANLISNAVRYTPEGGTITIAVKKGEVMASIIVADTGIGFNQQEAKMVFSRFWRADAGRDRESGGLGVGLAVVKEIVDKHKGWISAEGKPGVGATFTIHIPLYKENKINPSDEGNKREKRFLQNQSMKGKKK